MAIDIGTLNLKTKVDTTALADLKGSLSTIGKLAVDGLTSAGKAMTGLIADSVKEFGEFEQVAETTKLIYKDTFDEIATNGSKAWQTLGMSQAQYLEVANTTGATMKAQGIADDQLAAKNVSLTQSIADLSAAMGIDQARALDIVSQASVGLFSHLGELTKGYDNAEGAARLAAEASEAYGRELDPAQMGDFIDMLEYYNQKMGTSGQATREASTTIQGSLNMVKASWDNLRLAISDPDADLSQRLDEMLQAVGVAAENLMPVIQHAIEGVVSNLPDALAGVLEMLPDLVTSMGPTVATAAGEIVKMLGDGIIQHAPDIGTGVGEILSNIGTYISSHSSEIGSYAFDIVLALVTGIFNALPGLAEAAAGIIEAIASFLSEWAMELEQNGDEMCQNIVNGLIEAAPLLGEAALHLIDALVMVLVASVTQFVENGIAIGKAIYDGIKDFFEGTLIPWFKQAFEKVKQTAMNAVKTFVEVGKAIVNFIKEGLENAWHAVEEWVTSKIESLKSKISGVLSSLSGGGEKHSNAYGLAYVPYDGYVTQLHKGERVLTAQENEDYMYGGTSSGAATTNIFNITVPNNTNALDTAILLRDMIRADEFSVGGGV